MLFEAKEDVKALCPEPWETVWPKDSAIDLDQSDLVQWCTTGAMDGLVVKGDVQPTIFTLRPLPPRAYKRMLKTYIEHYDSVVEQALRMGFVSIDNPGPLGEKLFFGTEGGMRILTEESIDVLGEITMELPGEIVDASWQGPARSKDLLSEASSDLVPVSLARALGAQVLARTFRRRPLDA